MLPDGGAIRGDGFCPLSCHLLCENLPENGGVFQRTGKKFPFCYKKNAFSYKSQVAGFLVGPFGLSFWGMFFIGVGFFPIRENLTFLGGTLYVLWFLA